MDFDSAKENIQPLAGGRNVSLLQFALNAEKRQKEHDELIARRREYEDQIKGYSGDDPLSLWFEYISWIEQAFPKCGKESEFDTALQRCLQIFEHEDKYKQDLRMIKLYIKFIDSQSQANRHDFYSFLFNQGIGTMVAELYLGWAYYFEAVGNFTKADEIYRMGLRAHAEPMDAIQHSLTQLQILAAQGARCQDEDEYNSKLLAHMGERRFALTSLHGQTKRQVVGSLRTDAAVKSRTPGLILQENVQSGSSNIGPVPVFTGQSEDAEDSAMPSSSATSQIKSMVESALKAQENIREPGPWSSCGTKAAKKGSLFSKKEIQNTPGFDICEDSMEASRVETDGEGGGIQLPADFIRQNEPQNEFQVPLTIAEESQAVPQYFKHLVYPEGKEVEYSIEEVNAYRWWRKRYMKPDNLRVLQEMEGFMEKMYLPDDFARVNLPQSELAVEYFPFEGVANQQPMCKILSQNGCQQSYEELRKGKYLGRRLRRSEEAEKIVPPVAPLDNSVEMELEEMNQERNPPENNNRPWASPPASSESPFGFNETCSTQIFNLFIKPQSISTPNQGKKNKPILPRSSLSLYKQPEVTQQPPPQPPQPIPVSVASISPPDMIHTMGKQLSVIMETTENSASSGGYQTQTTTTTDATITKNSVVTDIGIQSLAAKPRKSILKKPECSVIESMEDVDTMPSPNVTVMENVPAGANDQPEGEGGAFAIFMDSPENEIAVGGKNVNESKQAAVEKNENSFLMPSVPISSSTIKNNVSIYRDSMDFFGIQPPPVKKQDDFAKPLPPKAKTFLPLYNDSMEHFIERAKTVPRIPIDVEEKDQQQQQQVEVDEMSGLFTASTSVSIYKMPEREELDERSKVAMPDFSIFHDSILAGKDKTAPFAGSGAIPKDKSYVREAPRDGSLSPLGSFMFGPSSQTTSTQRQMNPIVDHSLAFLESPKRGRSADERRRSEKEAIYGTSTESTMPTIAAIDPLLLEHSMMTFPSMKELTTNTMSHLDVRKLNNQSVKQQQLPPPVTIFEDSMTFNTLMTKEAGKATTEKSKLFRPNESIFNLQKELEEAAGGDDSPVVSPKPRVAIADESMTFNSLMRREGSKMAMNSNSIVAGVEGLNLKSEPTTTISRNIPQVPKLLNDSLTFHQFIKQEDEKELFAKPASVNGSGGGNMNQSTFPNLMVELPSSTSNGFSIFTKKNSFAVKEEREEAGGLGGGGGMRMETSISPIPSERHDEMDMVEDEEDIYKWENTLRVLPEAEEPDPDSWYNDHLDSMTGQQQVDKRKKKTDEEEEERKQKERRIGGKSYVDPFDPDVINDLLATVDFVNYLHKLNECDMKEKIPPLRQGMQLEICDQVFSVRKLIGKGAFGQIYSAKTSDGRLYALKQSRPCNLWEYYICMEVKCRLHEFNEDLLPAFIDIEYGLVAKNASVFVLPFCGFGNLINVCNEVKRETGRNLNEKVVMVLVAQILTIIDALHACQIIHADLKPDNFMLMGPIDGANFDRPVLKLIDFGQAIDMQLFPPGVEFSSSLATEGFTCSEMLENRPWTYQTDLYCVAGTIHTLLLGKYMAVQKGVCGYAVAKFPRYLQKVIWDEIFDHLLNVSDCKRMPNLQQMKLLLKQFVSDNENATLDEVRKFNMIVYRVQVLDK